MVHADPATKQAVIDAMRPVLEEWIGKVDTLDHTSTYGIRRYYNGSRCVLCVWGGWERAVEWLVGWLVG